MVLHMHSRRLGRILRLIVLLVVVLAITVTGCGTKNAASGQRPTPGPAASPPPTANDPPVRSLVPVRMQGLTHVTAVAAGDGGCSSK